MPLKLTRGADSFLYVGRDLKTSDLDGTSDHRLWVRRINNWDHRQSAIVNVMSDAGVTETVLDRDKNSLALEPGVSVSLSDIVNHRMERSPFCSSCGRGDPMSHRPVPQLKLSIDAPRDVSIIRDDARTKRD
jgi:hypothetical protein